MAEDSTGTIIKHGSVHPMELLKSAATAAAVWQVASMVVAQKHLADISEKLTVISADIKDMQSWLNHQQMGVLTGNYEYLNTIVSCFLSGELSEGDLSVFRINLEEVERESLQISHMTKALLRSQPEDSANTTR